MVPSTAARGTGPRSVAAYARVMALGAGVRVFGLASQFVVLIILSRVLFKGTFGDMMTAFGFYRLVGTALGVGPSLVLIYHLSRHPNDRALEVRLHRYAAILAAACSTVVALAGALLAQPVADVLGKPGLALWFVHLAPFAIFSTLLGVATGALEGRSRVSTSITVGELAPNLVRIVLLPLVAFLQLPDILVAHAITLSVLAPWLWAARGLFDRSIPGVQRWGATDFSYGGKFVIATLFASQLSTADVVVASALFSSETVADYAVASRLAALFSFLTLVLLKQFSPRAGYLMETDDRAALHREVELCRHLVIGFTALTVGGLLLAAPLLLPVFGNYGGALVFLAWLAIPSFIQSFYATSDRLLIIGGHANVALALTASSFLVLVTSPFVTARWLGLAAVPAAMIFSALAFNPLVAAKAKQWLRIATINWRDAAAMLGGSAALAAAALDGSASSRVLACALMAAVGAAYLIAGARATLGSAEAAS